MSNLVYLVTEEQKQALLKELELEKFRTPDQWAVTDEQKKAQRDAVESIHRRFVYHICNTLR